MLWIVKWGGLAAAFALLAGAVGPGAAALMVGAAYVVLALASGKRVLQAVLMPVVVAAGAYGATDRLAAGGGAADAVSGAVVGVVVSALLVGLAGIAWRAATRGKAHHD